MGTQHDKPSQEWSVYREEWKDRIRRLLVAIGAVSVIGVIVALVLPSAEAPNQDNYERCLEKAAEKANGAVAIYHSIRQAKCDRLQPNSKHPQMKEFVGEIDAERAIKTSSSNELNGPKELSDEQVFGKNEIISTAKLQQHQMPATFHGYICKGNCSGHAAGYRWAQRKGIDDEDDCTGNSESFIEGCIAYVEDNQ